MRNISQDVLDALSGSSSGARVSCDALYNGEVVASGLDVSSWSMSWRAGDQQMVQGSASFTVEDTGGLSPWGFDEPLSVGGSRIRTVFECAGDVIPMGEWVISSNEPNETWRLGARGSVKWVQGGASIPVQASDLTQLLADDKFMSPEAPQPGGTVFTELERLCAGVLPVAFVGVDDKSVPKNMVYNEERINTVADLARMIGDYRVNGDGLLEVFDPSRPSEPMWTIAPGEGGALVTVGRSQEREGLYNAVVATGQTEDGNELRAYAILEDGPLRFGGPFGRKPMETSSLATTPWGVRQDAHSTLANKVESSTTMLKVYCTPSPLYEIGDWGVVVSPMIDGSEFPLVGRCVEVALSGGSSGLDSMQLVMECSTADVMAVAQHVQRMRS